MCVGVGIPAGIFVLKPKRPTRRREKPRLQAPRRGTPPPGRRVGGGIGWRNRDLWILRQVRAFIDSGGCRGRCVKRRENWKSDFGYAQRGNHLASWHYSKDMPRTATVRCLTPVDVIMFNRKDFLILMATFGLFMLHIDQEVSHLLDQPEITQKPVGESSYQG